MQNTDDQKIEMHHHEKTPKPLANKVNDVTTMAAIVSTKPIAWRSLSDIAELQVAQTYSTHISNAPDRKRAVELTIQRRIRLRLVHAKRMLHRCQMARLGNIINLRTGLLDDQCIRRCQERRRAGSGELFRIPDNGGLGEAHVAGNRVHGIVKCAGGQHVNRRGLNDERSVVPAEGHFVANLVVCCRRCRGFGEGGGAGPEAWIDRGSLRLGLCLFSIIVLIVIFGGGFGWLARRRLFFIVR